MDVYRSIGPLSQDVRTTRACSWSIVDLVTVEEELEEVEETNLVAFIGEVMKT